MFLLIAINGDAPGRFSWLTTSMLNTLCNEGRTGELIPGVKKEHKVARLINHPYRHGFAFGTIEGGQPLTAFPRINPDKPFREIRVDVYENLRESIRTQETTEGAITIDGQNINSCGITILSLIVLAGKFREQSTLVDKTKPESKQLGTITNEIINFVKEVYNDTFKQSDTATLAVGTAYGLEVIEAMEKDGYYLTAPKNLQMGLRTFTARMKEGGFELTNEQYLILFLSVWANNQQYKETDLSSFELDGSGTLANNNHRPEAPLPDLKLEVGSRSMCYLHNMLQTLTELGVNADLTKVYRVLDDDKCQLPKLTASYTEDSAVASISLIKELRARAGLSEEDASLIALAFLGVRYRTFAENGSIVKRHKQYDPFEDKKYVHTLLTNDLSIFNPNTFTPLVDKDTSNKSRTMAWEVIEEYENSRRHLTHPDWLKSAVNTFHERMVTSGDGYRTNELFQLTPGKQAYENKNILLLFLSAWTSNQLYHKKPFSNIELGGLVGLTMDDLKLD